VKDKTFSIQFTNTVQQDIAATLDGLSARMLPESCAPEWPRQVPGQIAIVGPGGRVMDK